MAKGLLNWIRNQSARLIDPDRESRVESLAGQIDAEIGKLRGNFNLDALLKRLNYEKADDDVTDAGLLVYRRALQRAWRDGQLSDGERRSLDLIAQLLRLTPQSQRKAYSDAALDVFERAFAQAIDDGRLDAREIEGLRQIASALDFSLSDLVRTYFSIQGQAFLQGVFVTLAENGKLTPQTWSELLNVAGQLGMEVNEFRQVVAAQAKRLIEHTLTEAKADDRLDEREDRAIRWMLDHLPVSALDAQYVRDELEALRQLTNVQQGQLPSLQPPQSLALRSGEILHYLGGCRFTYVKALKSGPVERELDGTVAITDDRLIFASDEGSFAVSHRKVLQLTLHGSGVDAHVSGKGTGRYQFFDHLTALIYQVAVARSNQRLAQESVGPPTRHIPRDVRQRVWQRYGGQCADCGDRQYLEFDHIVPVAKGGSNSDHNVQLLCRRCNLKKSDHI